MKRIVVFGASGMTGLPTVEYGLKKGLIVRAFVRDGSKLPEHVRNKVEIAEGNVLDPESVARALVGADGVVICLGTRGSVEPTTNMSEGTKNIIKAMIAKNVKVVSAIISVFLFYDRSVLPEQYNDVTDDHRRMYEALRDSPLDYIVVNAPVVTEDPSHEYIVAVNPKVSPGKYISKLDLAAFLVDSLSEPKYYRTQIGIAHEKNVSSHPDTPELDFLIPS